MDDAEMRGLTSGVVINGSSPGRIQFMYRPIWKIDNRLIAIYRATPSLVEGERVLMGDAVLSNSWSAEQVAKLDELTLSRVVFDLDAHSRAGLNVIIVVPIHLASFVDEWSSKNLLKLCQRIPESARGNVVFEVLDALQVRSDARFKAAMRILRPFCRRFGAMMPIHARNFDFLRAAGFATVATEVSEQLGDEVQIIDALELFYMGSSQEGLLTAAWGLRTRSLMLAAATIGYDFINGQMIGAFPTGTLLNQVDYYLEDLYQEETCISL